MHRYRRGGNVNLDDLRMTQPLVHGPGIRVVVANLRYGSFQINTSIGQVWHHSLESSPARPYLSVRPHSCTAGVPHHGADLRLATTEGQLCVDEILLSTPEAASAAAQRNDDGVGQLQTITCCSPAVSEVDSRRSL